MRCNRRSHFLDISQQRPLGNRTHLFLLAHPLKRLNSWVCHCSLPRSGDGGGCRGGGVGVPLLCVPSCACVGIVGSWCSGGSQNHHPQKRAQLNPKPSPTLSTTMSEGLEYKVCYACCCCVEFCLLADLFGGGCSQATNSCFFFLWGPPPSLFSPVVSNNAATNRSKLTPFLSGRTLFFPATPATACRSGRRWRR